MSAFDDQRTALPPSFLARCGPLTVHGRPVARLDAATLEALAARHELCEDLAQTLVPSARGLLHDLGLHEDDVLTRIFAGLADESAGLQPGEAGWITHRLAELLAWEVPSAC
ncbi:ATPase with chaperone activity [Ideonella livida]|uniref:ATPase with chaperone activity n=1 Tax=Ideonella livida TaxID=2707176 RepID=A0A7C9PIX2_9BURK|nr:ATPase with chaperone activity [Ideonella livida]NDY93157.1 ATPase with chaperone activity [Ideonella livida]